MRRVHNFGAGPAALPLPVLEQVRDELLDFRGSGMSILEHSHRGSLYSEVHRDAEAALRELLSGSAGGAADHAILFMGGGARTQVALAPMNLLPAPDPAGVGPRPRADYVVTGRWAEMAVAEGAKRADARVVWSSADTGHDRAPSPAEVEGDADAAYLHYTSNNTVVGTQMRQPPRAPEGVPLVCDMSSDILSRPLDSGGDLSHHGVIYAGAQKNMGPAGVTVVIVRRDLLERSPDDLPDTFSYRKMAEKSSLLNTPPVFAIYVLGLVARWLSERGGLEAAAERSREKAETLYGVIDGSGGFYRGHARPDSRSRMNVTFRLPDEELETLFLGEAAEAHLVGLKGHRSVGGVRASIYNAVARESVERLAEFMERFRRGR